MYGTPRLHDAIAGGRGLSQDSPQAGRDMHKHATSPPPLSLRIDLAMDARIGPGKIQLLEAIAACGSISASGRAMDMSYKRAWDLVDELNDICGCKAVAQRIGGRNGGGTVLTPFGISLLARSENRAHCGTCRSAGSPAAAI